MTVITYKVTKEVKIVETETIEIFKIKTIKKKIKVTIDNSALIGEDFLVSKKEMLAFGWETALNQG